MAMERKVPDKETLTKWWVDEQLTRQEIADRWFKQTGTKVTLAALSMAASRYGLPGRKSRHKTLLPWRVKEEHLRDKRARLLRLASRRMTGLGNSVSEELWLDGWLEELRQQGRPVVAYYPDTEEGFFYHPRVAEDGDGEWDLIRRPEVQEILDRRDAG